MICDGVVKVVDAGLLKPSRTFGPAVYPGLGGLVVAEKAATLDVMNFFVSGYTAVAGDLAMVEIVLATEVVILQLLMGTTLALVDVTTPKPMFSRFTSRLMFPLLLTLASVTCVGCLGCGSGGSGVDG